MRLHTRVGENGGRMRQLGVCIWVVVGLFSLLFLAACGSEDGPEPLCLEDAECDDGDTCTDDICDAEIGCRNIPNEVVCDDDDPCTSGDRCSAGVCSGRPADVDRDGVVDLKCGGEDCDDRRAGVNPQAVEGSTQSSCLDGLDNDCDGLIDSEETACAQVQDEYAGALGLTDNGLKNWLENLVDRHSSLGYEDAKEEMFSWVDNQGGRVQCVYTGEWVETSGIPVNEVMNTEHTWCQSWGADSEPARSDLHHLFPTMMVANSVRGNLDFGEVVEPNWSVGGSLRGNDYWGHRVFEARDEHKGNAARAIFYFAIRYDYPIGARMELVLRDWHALDPPDEKELQRVDDIEVLQGNRNPFVDRVGFVDRISDF